VSELYSIECTDINGQPVSMDQFKDKVLLIVNTASRCGFTPQYEGLEALYNKYKEQGFEILAFPCNQFAGQEPEDEAAIKDFCSLNFNTSFPLFAKIEVNGDNTHPLFKFLKQQAPGILGSQSIKWNFTKFLVNRNGEVVKRFAPKDKPESLAGEIEKWL
jgi:glutathione peroxidase